MIFTQITKMRFLYQQFKTALKNMHKIYQSLYFNLVVHVTFLGINHLIIYIEFLIIYVIAFNSVIKLLGIKNIL